ncbi:VOC family protein [Paenibacillus sp. UMB4589-SE434]|uniref:VOC family protein n=1 Tax=Paenibacillus sp. UMB4589-SE434 TaxID=3046314 RepID=UPI00254D4733|nr:VOC family protein [Paenibacillus sp. UMB4589-SE434]MDK8181914.1 VOC family protein [Paenibacillus sp. UMB4589-SE434]
MTVSIHPKVMIGHVHLLVADLENMTRFYRDVIGFKIAEQHAQKVTFTADGRKPLLVLEQREGLILKPQRTTGLYHFAILLPERADLARALLHLAEQKTPMQGASDHGFSEALYLSDPEGNGIEIYADRPRSDWEGRVEQVGTTEALQVEDLLRAAEGNESWLGLPEQTIIGHIHLHVGNLKEADRFFVGQLGFKIEMSMADHALFIAAGGYHHHIGLNTWAGTERPPANSTGLYLYSLLFPDLAVLNQTVSRLQQLGIPVDTSALHPTIIDPTGSRIELRTM